MINNNSLAINIKRSEQRVRVCNLPSPTQQPPKKVKVKNECLKERPVDNPYEIWQSKDGTWEWRILKKWQVDDNKPYARWFCAVKSPMTYGQFDIGDVYVSEIKEFAKRIK